MIVIETTATSRYEIDEDKFWTIFGLEFEDEMGVSLEEAGDTLKRKFITQMAYEVSTYISEELDAIETYDDFEVDVTFNGWS